MSQNVFLNFTTSILPDMIWFRTSKLQLHCLIQSATRKSYPTKISVLFKLQTDARFHQVIYLVTSRNVYLVSLCITFNSAICDQPGHLLQSLPCVEIKPNHYSTPCHSQKDTVLITLLEELNIC